jgi:hypothetical protein
MAWRDSDSREAPAYAPSDLKICDLCGALNLASNRECFVCRWHGNFDRRSEIVSNAMELLERKHGRIDLALVSGSPCTKANEKRNAMSKLQCFWTRLVQRIYSWR